MGTQIIEAMFLMTSAILLPAIALLIYLFFRGNLTATESSRFLPLRDPEPDYWSETDGSWVAGRHAQVSSGETRHDVAKEGEHQ